MWKKIFGPNAIWGKPPIISKTILCLGNSVLSYNLNTQACSISFFCAICYFWCKFVNASTITSWFLIEVNLFLKKSLTSWHSIISSKARLQFKLPIWPSISPPVYQSVRQLRLGDFSAAIYIFYLEREAMAYKILQWEVLTVFFNKWGNQKDSGVTGVKKEGQMHIQTWVTYVFRSCDIVLVLSVYINNYVYSK